MFWHFFFADFGVHGRAHANPRSSANEQFLYKSTLQLVFISLDTMAKNRRWKQHFMSNSGYRYGRHATAGLTTMAVQIEEDEPMPSTSSARHRFIANNSNGGGGGGSGANNNTLSNQMNNKFSAIDGDNRNNNKKSLVIIEKDKQQKHVIVSINDTDIDDDDDEIYFERTAAAGSGSENDSLLVAYDSNSVSSVWQMNYKQPSFHFRNVISLIELNKCWFINVILDFLTAWISTIRRRFRLQ